MFYLITYILNIVILTNNQKIGKIHYFFILSSALNNYQWLVVTTLDNAHMVTKFLHFTYVLLGAYVKYAWYQVLSCLILLLLVNVSKTITFSTPLDLCRTSKSLTLRTVLTTSLCLMHQSLFLLHNWSNAVMDKWMNENKLAVGIG